jgi:F-type H+-transporting ATPase subunit delta
MKTSKLARRNAKQLFRLSLVAGLPDAPRVRQIVQRIIAARPRGYLSILAHLLRLVKLDAARRNARIESAVPLPPELQTGVQASLARIYGPGLEFSVTRNASLLGGMRIRVGSDVYDSSVQARLSALEQSF